jgi:hypothetical protein
MVDLLITGSINCTYCKHKVGYKKVQHIILFLDNYTVKKVNDFPVPSRDGSEQTLSGHGEFGE